MKGLEVQKEKEDEDEEDTYSVIAGGVDAMLVRDDLPELGEGVSRVVGDNGLKVSDCGNYGHGHADHGNKYAFLRSI